jgi:hypothetical protein
MSLVAQLLHREVKQVGSRRVPPKRQLIFNGLHSGISQKIELCTTTAVRRLQTYIGGEGVLEPKLGG